MRLPRDRIVGEPRHHRLLPARFHRLLYAVPLRLRSLFKRGQVERQLAEEFHYHIERRTEKYMPSYCARFPTASQSIKGS